MVECRIAACAVRGGMPAFERWVPKVWRLCLRVDSHAAATPLRREFGIEVARVILGHRDIGVTQLCAEADKTRAVEIMGANWLKWSKTVGGRLHRRPSAPMLRGQVC